ncbi:MAG: PilZ domain-containing protein [Proteobacteria bacterium]|nr:PilZ domain-containing protein [Pseudomonadota bacterium]MBU1057311.1 PilZ domain-containing protein [Pseudomonadota bacterium]
MDKGRRRFQRIPFEVPAELTVNAIVYHTERIGNLSIGGCLFPLSTGIVLEEKSACSLIIQLNKEDDRAQITVGGEVVYCKQGMAGIKFTHIDPTSLFHLRNIILYNAAEPDEVEREIFEHPGLV